MVKSTKLVRAISSIITFQKRIPQGIQSVTIKGKESLADLELDKNYDMDLKLNADKDKLNNVSSSVPFIQATTTTSGSVPDEQKSVTLAQDLREFPMSSGELVTVEKTENALTLNDSKVKEFVESKTEALKKELGTGKGSPASTLTLNGGELVTVDKAGDTLTLNDSKVKELVETTKTEILKKVEPTKPFITPYNLNKIAENILNATLSINMDPLSFGAFTITTQTGSNVETYTYFLHQSVVPVYIKSGANIIVFINVTQYGANVEIYFKNPVDMVYVSGINAYQSTDTHLDVNIASSNYNEMQANMAESIATSGNVPQPFDEGYDHL